MMNERGIYIGKNTDQICFGQTGTISSFNEFSDTILFQADGEKEFYELHYLEVIPTEYLYKYPERHNYLNANGQHTK